MYFNQGKLFEYAFMFSGREHDGDEDSDTSSFDAVKDWCNENLSGQWIVFDNSGSYSSHRVKFSYYSRATHSSPVDNTEYPPAEIKIAARYVIAFETEEDATAFKLRWDQVDVC